MFEDGTSRCSNSALGAQVAEDSLTLPAVETSSHDATEPSAAPSPGSTPLLDRTPPSDHTPTSDHTPSPDPAPSPDRAPDSTSAHPNERPLPAGGRLPFTEAGAAALERMSSEDLLELIAAWDRVEAQAAANKRSAAAQLEERLAPRIVHGRQGRVEVKGQAACEVAIRLGISTQRASLLVGEGLLFNGILSDVGVALAEGVIDAGKAALFAKVLSDQEPAIAFAVMDTVLPLAPGKPHARLEKALNAELIRVDPAAASKRFERAMRQRRVEQVQLRPDGMASIRLVGAVFDVARVYVHTDAVARATKSAGDARTLDQLRADTLISLVTDQLPPPATTPNTDPESGGPGGNGGQGGNGGAGGPGGSGGPGGNGGSGGNGGPVESELDRVELLIAGLRSSSARTKNKGEPPPLSMPIERPPLIRATGAASRLTLVLAGAHLHPPGDDDPPSLADTYRNDLYVSPLSNEGSLFPDPVNAPGSSTADSSKAGCSMAGSYGPDSSTAGSYQPDSSTADSSEAGSCQPVDPPAVLGRDVPYLLGFGPIDPFTARALIADHPANLSIKTYEDLQVEHVEWLTAAPEKRHDPCPALQRHLAAYYPTCIAPTCTVRATVCDNDHVIEYPLGPTHVTNLRPLCRHHHLLKTHAGHRLELDQTGTLTWITALGTRRPTQHQRR